MTHEEPDAWKSFQPIVDLFLRSYATRPDRRWASMVYRAPRKGWVACGEGLAHAVLCETAEEAMAACDGARTTLMV